MLNIIKTGKRKKDRQKSRVKLGTDEIQRMQVLELFDIKKLRLGENIWKDGKRLEKFLWEVVKAVNSLISCA